MFQISAMINLKTEFEGNFTKVLVFEVLFFEVLVFKGVRTKHGPLVHQPPFWTGSMDHLYGPLFF